MSGYRNFTVDFPKRVAELDKVFRPHASDSERSVTYTLMRLASGFLLPYERTIGKSGAGRTEVGSKAAIRRVLELDKPFCNSSYFSIQSLWSIGDVDEFDAGPKRWAHLMRPIDKKLLAWQVLQILRHATAHSNLFFAGEQEIDHVYLGNSRERGEATNKYQVVCCTPISLESLLDSWFRNVQRLRESPALIWRELELAA